MRPRTTAQIFAQYRIEAIQRFFEAHQSGLLSNMRAAGAAYLEVVYAAAQAETQERQAA